MPQIYFLISHQLSFQCTVLLGHVAFLTLQLIANGLFVSPGRAAVDSSDEHHVAADVNHPALKYHSPHHAYDTRYQEQQHQISHKEPQL